MEEESCSDGWPHSCAYCIGLRKKAQVGGRCRDGIKGNKLLKSYLGVKGWFHEKEEGFQDEG